MEVIASIAFRLLALVGQSSINATTKGQQAQQQSHQHNAYGVDMRNLYGFPFVLLFASIVQSTEFDFVPVNYPGADETVVYGANNLGVVVGEYGSIDFTQQFIAGNHGFIYDGTTYQSVEYPDAQATSLQGINDAGLVVGDFVDANGRIGSFIFDGETFEEIGQQLGAVVGASDINNHGHIVGTFQATQDVLAPFSGFFFNGETYEEINFGRPSDGLLAQTFLLGINDQDTKVGIGRYLFLLNNEAHQGGFLHPGFDPIEIRNTFAFSYGINNDDVVAGAVGVRFSEDMSDTRRRFWGFIRQPGAEAELVQLPGDPECFFDVDDVNDPTVPDRCLSFIRDVNDRGQIVGYFDNNDGVFQGFLGTPVESQVCDLDSNGSCGTADIDSISAAIRDGDTDPIYDLDDDGSVGPSDHTEWFVLAGVSVGDADLDGDVDTADQTSLVTNWTGALPSGGTLSFSQGDNDGDGDVDSADQTSLVLNWTGALSAANVVPEPHATTLLLAALVGLACLSSIRRKRCLLDSARFGPHKS